MSRPRLPCRCTTPAPDSVSGNCFRCGRSYRPGRIPTKVLDIIYEDLVTPGEELVLPRSVWLDDKISEPQPDHLSPTGMGKPKDDGG